MNDVLKELVKQSTTYYKGGLGTEIEIFDKEKFAELIVREYSYDCMDVTCMPEHIQFVAKKWGVEL